MNLLQHMDGNVEACKLGLKRFLPAETPLPPSKGAMEASGRTHFHLTPVSKIKPVWLGKFLCPLYVPSSWFASVSPPCRHVTPTAIIWP